MFQPDDKLSGIWDIDFDTQIGLQKYVMSFSQQGGQIVAKAKADLSGRTREVEFAEVELKDDVVSFVENLSFGGNEIRIEYAGKIIGDTIEFSRKVGDFASEQATAKRSSSVEDLMTENAKATHQIGPSSDRQ